MVSQGLFVISIEFKVYFTNSVDLSFFDPGFVSSSSSTSTSSISVLSSSGLGEFPPVPISFSASLLISS